MSKASQNEPAPRCLKMALWLAGQGLRVVPVHNPVGPKHERKCSCGNPQCPSQAKHPRTRHGIKDASKSKKQIRRWFKKWPDANVGVATGKASEIIVLDVDPRHGGDKSLAMLEAEFGQLPSTWRFQTGGGGEHYYFKHPGGHFPNSSGKVGDGLDVRGDGGYVVARPSRHISGKLYKKKPGYDPKNTLLYEAPPWFLELALGKRTGSATESSNFHPHLALDGVPEGQRDETIFRYASSCCSRGLYEAEAIDLVRLAAQRCKPPFDEGAAIEKVRRAYVTYGSPCRWPDPLGDAAFHGLAGEIVKAIEPHTEADSAAILFQLLVAFGNVIGRRGYFLVEADRHHLNLFTTLVGESAKSRKGTSLGHVRRLFRDIDEIWELDHFVSGLSSGEGLIWRVRDGTSEDDLGVTDKRLLVIESEFASTLRILGREGNTLSPTLRNAWDLGKLTTLTKKSPTTATDAHISVIGHITVDELRRYLTQTEAGNGFANRFLWVCVRRSKILPEGGRLCEQDMDPLISRLRDAVSYAQVVRKLHKTDKAIALWKNIYPELSEGKPGIFGAVTARAEAQVMRLACIYALLDCKKCIKAVHLKAALEVWRYSEDSARHIFESRHRDTTVDRILLALKENPGGLSRNGIYDFFQRNVAKDVLERALKNLSEAGLATCTKKTSGRGRRAEIWALVPHAH